VKSLTKSFWWQVVLAVANALLAAVTVVWPDWLELVFQVDPDHGNGSFEWLVVGVTTASALGLFIRAGREWERARV
jgi:hypothetical protein